MWIPDPGRPPDESYWELIRLSERLDTLETDVRRLREAIKLENFIVQNILEQESLLKRQVDDLDRRVSELERQGGS